MNDLIGRFGGDGIIVSRSECLQRYPCLRAHLAGSGVPVPANPKDIYEWSTIMAFTGVLNAIDRQLIPRDRDVVIHGSGCYAAGM